MLAGWAFRDQIVDLVSGTRNALPAGCSYKTSPYGPVLHFIGNRSIIPGLNPIGDSITGAFSQAFSVCFRASVPASSNALILGRGEDGFGGWSVQSSINNVGFDLHFIASGSQTDYNVPKISSSGAWHSYAWTVYSEVGSNWVDMYIDGVRGIHTALAGSSLRTSTIGIMIAQCNTSLNQVAFDLDYLYVLQYPLFAGDALAIHQNPYALISPGPIPIPRFYSFTPPVAVTTIGIASTNAFGTLTSTEKYSITLTGITSTNAFGTLSAKEKYSTTLTGVASTNAFGTLSTDYKYNTSLTGVASDNAFGALTITEFYNVDLSGIASANIFGNLVLSDNQKSNIALTGITSANAFGTLIIGEIEILQSNGNGLVFYL